MSKLKDTQREEILEKLEDIYISVERFLSMEGTTSSTVAEVKDIQFTVDEIRKIIYTLDIK